MNIKVTQLDAARLAIAAVNTQANVFPEYCSERYKQRLAAKSLGTTRKGLLKMLKRERVAGLKAREAA